MTKKLLEKKVMLYLGKDSNYNYRAIPLRNTVIAGGLGSGVISLNCACGKVSVQKLY